MGFGKQLAELRKRHHLKQKELAEKLNVSQQVISNIENDKTNPDVELLRKIADLYGMSMDRIIGRDFSEDDSDSIEKEIMKILKGMNQTGKELSLDLVNQVAQHQGNNDGIE